MHATRRQVALIAVITASLGLISCGAGGGSKSGGGVTTPVPVITSFAANPATIVIGDNVTLTWATTNATSVSISNIQGSLPVSGSVTVKPTESTSYTLTATGPGGTATATATVTVSAKQPAAAPVITSFTANPSTISAGGSTVLTWSTQNATEVTISGINGDLAPAGSVTVKPTATSDYMLTAANADEMAVTAQTRVTVNSGVQIKTFTVSPKSINAGGQATLTWDVLNATRVTINGANQPASGTLGVNPSVTTTYALVATAADETTAERDVILTVTQPDASGLKKINHIIFMVQENRSFDQYFGKLNDYRAQQGLPRDIDGLTSAMSNPTRDFTDTIKPFHLRTQCMDNPTPSWNDAHPQRNHFHPACTASSCSPALMDGFVYDASSFAINNGYFDTQGARAMGYYTEDDMPYYYFMATQFATSNRFFAPVMTRTQPNLMYLFSGTSAGYIYPPAAGDPTLSNKTIFQLLEEAGISWKFYLPDGTESNIVFVFQPFTNQHMDHFVPVSQYFTDLQNGTLPQVAFIASKPGFDEHPGPDSSEMKWPNTTPPQGVGIHMQWGVQYVADIINSLMKSNSWKDSVFIWSFDEWGGTFDHVPPMKAVPPDDIPPRFRRDANGEITDTLGDFSYTGFRIPMMVISPYTKPHYVSNTPMDLTAILRLIEERFDLPSLTHRDAAQKSMTEFFDFDNPAYLTPPNPPVQPGNMLCDRTQIP
jgi:phospholipase C